ncbi:HEAT repeat domain-containing protein [Nostoc sp. LPT]|uniref:HEAT repeat domain-containing protein n=1 Tax=Nostoc sp. LPT TaxID=2815387 RepID=UPI001D84F75A|nr:HEAT repeat domain-containing protein [Nostoc sp. LPT]MBN4001292.1 HEAT repeat domain-containing protein [Nostoc sp. LPT]
MSTELLTIAGSVGKAVFPEIVKKINSALNPTDLEKALKAGVQSAEEWDANQDSDKHLFFRCTPKDARELLERFFKDTGVQEELQKPFTEKTIPNLEVLIQIFHKIKSEKSNLKFHDESIKHWLKKFVDAYFEHTNTYLKFQIAKSDYLKQLSRYFDGVEFVGIKVKTKEEEKFAKLPQIFVMPNVVEQVEARESKGLKLNLDLALEETVNQQRQQNLLWEQQSSGKKFSAQELLKESTRNKFVVLGEPGIGKTTLMSYFAVMLAEQQTEKLGLSTDLELLPILIRIRDLGKASTKNLLEYVRNFANSIHVKELPKGFFEHWLDDGRALILLDGLDEIAKPSDRYEFVKIIHSFLGQYSQNRAIITSRPAGYSREFFGTDEFPHYHLEKFDDSQIDLFIQQWYNSRLPNNPEKAQERQESLKKALAAQKRIKLLARNPLLLTIIALIHRYDAHLPRQRYKLYEQAVDTLLINWDVNKGIESWKLNYIKLDDIKILMQRLAYWIHSQGETGDKEGGTLIERDELITQLSEYICDYYLVHKHQAKTEAERLVDHITERCGLLNEQGQDRYAFVHKTFQEYLAGEEIRDRQSEDFNEVLNHIRDYLHNSHWREVLLLLIAQQNQNNSKKIIEAILQHETLYEEWLHRNLLFAGTCLAEDLKLSDGKLITDILQKLVELEVSNSQQVGREVKSQVFQIICNLNETRFQAQALEQLKASADLIDKRRLREYRAALGEQQEVLAELLGLLKDKSESVRNSAAFELSMLGNASSQVVEALLGLLKDESESSVCYSAALALGILGNASLQIVEALLGLLKDESEIVLSSAALVFSMLENASPLVVEALLGLLKDKSQSVCLLAAFALGKLSNPSPQVVEALLGLLKDESKGMRNSATEALGKLGNASPLVVEALLGLLKDKSEIVRESATEALGKLGNASPLVVEALLTLLKDESEIVRESAALALGKLGNTSPQLVEVLLGLLKDKSKIVRNSAADALGKLGNASPLVVEALLGLLKDKSEIVRESATEALGKLGNASPLVVEALLTLLKDESEIVRESAAEALGKLGNASPLVVEALLGLLNDESKGVRNSATEALGKLGKNSSNVTATVAEWISQHQDSEYVGNGIDALWNLVVTEE